MTWQLFTHLFTWLIQLKHRRNRCMGRMPSSSGEPGEHLVPSNSEIIGQPWNTSGGTPSGPSGEVIALFQTSELAVGKYGWNMDGTITGGVEEGESTIHLRSPPNFSAIVVLMSWGFMSHVTQTFPTRSSQPISCCGTEETKPSTRKQRKKVFYANPFL